eukprot:g1559.t3
MQVVIVGAGRADLVAQTKAVEKKFPDKFFYAGWMGPERYALLAGCDYTLLPSRWEPCGLVQMEAMRLGTLPIVAPTGGLKDTVEDGVNGLWTEKEMTEPSKVVKMKQAAMAAAAEFTWSNAALQYEAIFEELGVKDVLGGRTETALTTRGAIATSFDTTPTDGADGGALTSEYDQALRRAISVQACGKCAVSLCSSCVRTRLGPDPCCPGCGDREVFNVKAVQFQRNASQISSSASQLWDGLLYFGQGLFNIESTGTEQVPAAPLLVPGS